MKIYWVSYILYLIACVNFLFLIIIPLASDLTISNAFLRKPLIILPFVLVILGKCISIIKKKKNNEETLKDWGMNIGLGIAMILFLFS